MRHLVTMLLVGTSNQDERVARLRLILHDHRHRQRILVVGHLLLGGIDDGLQARELRRHFAAVVVSQLLLLRVGPFVGGDAECGDDLGGRRVEARTRIVGERDAEPPQHVLEMDRFVLQCQFQFRFTTEGERFREGEDGDSAVRVVATCDRPAAVLVGVVDPGRNETSLRVVGVGSIERSLLLLFGVGDRDGLQFHRG